MDNYFQIFGSKSSKDIDVMVIVDDFDDNPYYELEKCKQFNSKLSIILNTTNEINSNLAVVKDGIIIKVLKGTSDECNNSMFLTYDHHKQYFPNIITKLVKRDLELKMIRTARVLLSLISRTNYRPIIKEALQHGFIERVEALYKCDISNFNYDTIINKNVTYEDFIKVYAFQIGQTLALIDNIELYTKEDIIDYYPELKPYILRDISSDLKNLEKAKIKLLNKFKKFELKTNIEYKI